MTLGLDKGLDGLGKYIKIFTNQSTLKKVQEDWKWDHIVLINDSGRLSLKEVVFQDGTRVVENASSISK